MHEILLQAIPTVEKLGDAKEWIFYVITLLVSYGVGATVGMKFLYKRNSILHEKYEKIYPDFLEEQKNFYKLYIESSGRLAEVIRNNSLALLSVENTMKNNIIRVEELTKNMKEQSEKTLITLDKLTEKILQATHEHI